MVETLILAGVIDRIQAPGEMKHVTPNRHLSPPARSC